MRLARFSGAFAVLVAAFTLGCGSAPPPPPAAPAEPAPAPEPAAAEPAAAPDKEKVESGIACAPGESECSGGMCTVHLKSTCDQPVTCELAIVANCKSGTTMVEARARSRETIPAKGDGKLSALAKCNEGQVVHTELKEFRCR